MRIDVKQLKQSRLRRVNLSQQSSRRPIVVGVSATLLLALISCATTAHCQEPLQTINLDRTASSASEPALVDLASQATSTYFTSNGPSGLEEDQLEAAAAAAGTSHFTRPVRQSPPPDAFVAVPASDQDEEAAEEKGDELTGGQEPFDYHSNMPVITKRELAQAIKQATASMDKQLFDMGANGGQLEPSVELMEAGSAGWLATSMFHKRAPVGDHLVLNQTRQALISEETTRLLARQYKLNRLQTLKGLPLISVDQTSLGRQCLRSARQFSCLPGQYRSLSGHCNNVQNPEWAASQTPLVRYAPARYADNIAKPFKSARGPLQAGSSRKDNSPLPSARAVSMAIYGASTGGGAHSHMTTMLSFFGQFVFHDLAFVPQTGTSIKCCQSPRASSAKPHPECMPIEFQSVSGQEEQYCLDYVRSAPAVRSGCNLGHRDQLNLVTAYLDGSAIYGSTEAQMRRLRAYTGGRLRSQRAPIGHDQQSGGSSPLELLPQIKLSLDANSSSTEALWANAAEECRQMASMRRTGSGADDQHPANCFQAGDIRVNENIGLTLMHTIWMREHNHIADRLGQLNKHWRDERLFEEARRIVVAELQHIAFAEFLPSILGEEVMQRFNLSILNQGYSQNYDPQLSAAVSNELATAVFPFILSTIPSALERYSERLEMLGSTSLTDTFMDGSDLFKRNRFAQYLTGMMSQSAMEPVLGVMPMTMTDQEQGAVGGRLAGQEVRNSSRPINGAHQPPQIDAVALTIQKGRDHGLRSYLYWRRVCQLKPLVRSWQDLGQVMPSGTVNKLRQVYASVEQLDLYLALLESPAPGATIWPTFVCLLARQFFHTKHGDRYWFENDLPGLAFTPRQLDEIRQTSLAKVMCRNSQSSISFIQPAPMLASDPYLNAYQYCTNKAMDELDLRKWQQAINSAQQFADEQLTNDLMRAARNEQPSLARGKRLIEENSQLIISELDRAKRQLDSIAKQEAVKVKAAMVAKIRSRRHSNQAEHSHRQPTSGANSMTSSVAAGYRYLPRPKRQALRINNQSVIYELATNEVVRSLIRSGKDREQAQSLQSDIRDFLYSLEMVQLDNLLDNSASSNSLHDFINGAGLNFLTHEQRLRLAATGDPTLTSEPLVPSDVAGSSSEQPQRTSSVSANCQDDDKAFPCDHTTPFRTITGWCNNLNNPKYGQSFTPLDRILPSAYEDGLSRPRQFSVNLALDGQDSGNRLQLPSPRLISTTLHNDKSQLHVRYSLALMQFGQFGVDHDLTRTPFSVALDGSLLDCSSCDSQRTVHRDCLPIEIPDNDNHFHSDKARELTGSGRKCLHFVRSLNGQVGLGPRQQINALTAYIDASNVYGSDNCEAKSLRAFGGGRLNSSAYPSSSSSLGYAPKEILPVTRANPECVTPSGLCFHAGDQRASEQPGLTAFHTIFMRLHNSIVGQLAAVNRHWNDEKLYQQGRRIVAAISQRITYNEFAPRILGLDYMSKFDLMLKQVGYADGYDETCSASILTEFAAAAFRMGHSLIRNAFPLLNRQYKPVGKAFQLRTAFFNSQRILSEPQLIDNILRGVVSAPIESLDNSITEELTNHLFEKPKQPFSGMDLISLNIQRARDHGIAGYNKYRVKCNLTRARTFEELAGEIPQKLIKRLASLYATVDDIDLFPGAMSELPVHGGIIGPTFGCMIGMQLSRLKRCDRYWHETSDPFVRFSATQLAEIRKTTLAKVICSQSDTIDSIQRNAMDVSDHYL